MNTMSCMSSTESKRFFVCFPFEDLVEFLFLQKTKSKVASFSPITLPQNINLLEFNTDDSIFQQLLCIKSDLPDQPALHDRPPLWIKIHETCV